MANNRNFAGSGSYVLGAMDADEREEFEGLLADSAELRSEVTELTDTAVLLGMAVDPVDPSPALKQNIMARLSQTPQLPREDAPVRALRAVPALEEEPEALPGSTGAAVSKARTRWYTRPAVAITAAAAAVLLIAGGIVGTNVAIQGANSSQQADALAAITTASDVQRAQASVSTGGTATLVWSLHLKKSVLIGKGLKTLPAGKTYELWYINSAGTPTPAGLFESKGASTLQVLSGTMTKGDTVGVTVEPAGGSKAPTTKPIVAIASA
jgi:anti-sigma-K factor RskA